MAAPEHTEHSEEQPVDLYRLVVFIHASTILLFFIAHGTSMAVAFQLRRESEPTRVRALLELSRFSLGVPTGVVVVVGLLAGIAAGFMGGWWGQLWIWISLVLFVAVGGAMTPLASSRLNAIRLAAGMPGIGPPFAGQERSENTDAAQPVEDPAELRRLIAAWNPLPIAAAGLTTFLVILWLMLFKPF